MVFRKKPIITVAGVNVNGRYMGVDKDQRNEAETYKIITDLCCRIERMCRYSPLDNKECDEQSINDRNIVAGIYKFYRDQGDDEDVAAKKARANAIRLILNEAFS